MSVVFAAAALYACVTNSFEDGQFTCEPPGSGACPPGLLCAADGFCRSSATEAGAQTDGGFDAASDGGDGCGSRSWRDNFNDRRPHTVATGQNGDLFVGGSAKQSGAEGPSGWIARLDPCSGALLDEVIFRIGSRRTIAVEAIVWADERPIVVGNAFDEPDGATGFYETFSATVDWASQQIVQPVSHPRSGTNDVTRAIFADDGALWFSGSSGDRISALGLLVRNDGGSLPICELSRGEAGSALAGLVASPSAGAVYTLVRVNYDAGPSSVLEVNASCLVQARIEDPDRAHLPTDLASANGKLYVTGSYSMGGGGDSVAYLSEVSQSSWMTVTENSSSSSDSFRQVASDGEHVYVGGFAADTRFGEIPYLYRYPLPITPTTKKDWARASVFGVGSNFQVVDVQVTPRGSEGVFVAGSRTDTVSGVIVRCTKSGECN